MVIVRTQFYCLGETQIAKSNPLLKCKVSMYRVWIPFYDHFELRDRGLATLIGFKHFLQV